MGFLLREFDWVEAEAVDDELAGIGVAGYACGSLGGEVEVGRVEEAQGMDSNGVVGWVELVDSVGNFLNTGWLIISNKQQFVEGFHQVGEFGRVSAVRERLRDGHRGVRGDHRDDADGVVVEVGLNFREFKRGEVIGVVDGDLDIGSVGVPYPEAVEWNEKRDCVGFEREDGFREDSERRKGDGGRETSGVIHPPRVPDAVPGAESREGGPVPGSGSGCSGKGHVWKAI